MRERERRIVWGNGGCERIFVGWEFGKQVGWRGFPPGGTGVTARWQWTCVRRTATAFIMNWKWEVRKWGPSRSTRQFDWLPDECERGLLKLYTWYVKKALKDGFRVCMWMMPLSLFTFPHVLLLRHILLTYHYELPSISSSLSLPPPPTPKKRIRGILFYSRRRIFLVLKRNKYF